ncbi:putative iron/ascorbate-dependent oxidoreductase domain protein [Candidatus Erwinia dacicola]|uniref:Iron/ascorbate-dependent oxidoreductase domain protein n=1 Tax=Candidatus Erwinia dacicola TaxID=252393 RepID=A0A328TS09_9GAMM|nr:putative iron/ascorbate-dependent oxidoreductase domain protein [Candidatus Erwinia dacicola]
MSLRCGTMLLGLPADAFDPLYGDKPNEHIKLISYPGQAENTSD